MIVTAIIMCLMLFDFLVIGLILCFFDNCKNCKMNSFIGDTHCCKCKNNYPHLYADTVYVEYYEHCCDCKEVYSLDDIHLCKKKID